MICLDKYKMNDIVRVTNCKHIYHKECLDDWLKNYSYKCPICRKELGNSTYQI